MTRKAAVEEWFKAFLAANLIVVVLSTVVYLFVEFPWQASYVVVIVFLTSVVREYRRLNAKQEQPVGRTIETDSQAEAVAVQETAESAHARLT